MPTDLTRSRLREIAARRDPDELAAVVEMLADETPVDREWFAENGWFLDPIVPKASHRGISVYFPTDPFGHWAVYAHGMGTPISKWPARGQLRCLMLALSGGE